MGSKSLLSSSLGEEKRTPKTAETTTQSNNNNSSFSNFAQYQYRDHPYFPLFSIQWDDVEADAYLLFTALLKDMEALYAVTKEFDERGVPILRLSNQIMKESLPLIDLQLATNFYTYCADTIYANPQLIFGIRW